MLPLLTFAVLIRHPIPWHVRFGRIAASIAAALILLGPWVIRNLLVFEKPVFLSNGAGTVLVQSNCEPTYHGEFIGYWRIECGHPAPFGPSGEHLDESERDSIVRQRALDFIDNNRGRLLTAVIPARIGRMWGVYDPIDQLRLDAVVDRRPLAISIIGYAQYLTLIPLSISGAVLLYLSLIHISEPTRPY